MNENDLLLILDRDPKSLCTLRRVAESLGCDCVEADSADSLKEVLTSCRPTIAVLAVDGPNVDGLAILRLLAHEVTQPATLLIGAVHARVLAGARKTAEAQGLPVIGVAARPLDPVAIELLLMPHLKNAPPIALGELERALTEHELILEYLPKIDIRNDELRMRGVEALVRWQHPRLGLLYPRQFLGPIEDHQLMARLTDFVMTEAVRQA
ncbi:MAG TPA: EAL domain-containing protein, partial [Steroidobacteraceae bacterium]